MYNNYDVSDFLADELFLKWCIEEEDEAINQYWEEWLRVHPAKKDVVQEARKIIGLMNFDKHSVSTEKVEVIRMNIHSKIGRNNDSFIEKTFPGKVRSLFEGHLYKVATFATVLALITATYFTAFYRSDLISSSVGYGKTKEVILPDSSLVKLNSNSSICYSKEWKSGEDREVWIEGEAFFSVRHTKNNRKFIVHSSKLNVEVLGTRFNVNNRKGITKVILNSGKVKLSEAEEDKTLVMSPGELVEYNPEKRIFDKQMIEAETATSWKNNELIFSNTPLITIASILEDNYGLNISFADPESANKKFTGTVPVKDVEILITSISESFNLNVKRNKNNIVFTKK